MRDTSRQLSQLPLFNLVTGFMSFKTFAAAVDFEVFTRLAGGREVTSEEFAEEFKLAPRPTVALLAGLVSIGLLEKNEGRYRNSELAETFLIEGRPYYFGNFVQFYDRALYPGFMNLPTVLQNDRSAFAEQGDQNAVFDNNDFLMQFFWNALDSLARYMATACSKAYDFGAHKRLLDVGGGAGGFSIELCGIVPGLAATVYELPHVCSIVEKKSAEAGLEGVVDAHPGDYTKDGELPAGYDLMVLSQVLHCEGEQTNRGLLAKCFDAVEPGGTVMILELLLDAERTGPTAAAMMGMNMLVGHAQGQNYSESEYSSWLTDAGFVDVEVVRFESASANGAVLGRKPTAADR